MGNQIVPNGPKVQFVLMELFYLGSWKCNRGEKLFYLGSWKYNREEGIILSRNLEV